MVLFVYFFPNKSLDFFHFSFSCRHQSTGADAHLPAKMVVAVAKRMHPLFVNVFTAGLEITVTFLMSHVRLLHARKVFLCSVYDEIWSPAVWMC